MMPTSYHEFILRCHVIVSQATDRHVDGVCCGTLRRGCGAAVNQRAVVGRMVVGAFAQSVAPSRGRVSGYAVRCSLQARERYG